MSKGQADWMRWLIIGVTLALIIMFIAAFTTEPKEYTLPSNFKRTPITGVYATLLKTIGAPDNWLWIPGIIYLFFVPLLGITVIAYGFLDAMQIFPNINVNLILALVIAFATIPFGVFTKFVMFLFALMGVYSTGAFAFLFFFGVLYVIISRMTTWGFLTGSGRTGTLQHATTMQSLYSNQREWLEETIRLNINRKLPEEFEKHLQVIAKTLDKADEALRKEGQKKAIDILTDMVRKTSGLMTTYKGSVVRPRLSMPLGRGKLSI